MGNNVCYRPDYAEDHFTAGPSNSSPIDWNNDGAITNLTGCIGLECPDINNDGGHGDQLDTTPDWTQVNGQFIPLNFQFQCTQGFQNDKLGSEVPSPITAQ